VRVGAPEDTTVLLFQFFTYFLKKFEKEDKGPCTYSMIVLKNRSIQYDFEVSILYKGRSQQPCGVTHEPSSLRRTLGSGV
jgi:hypothetical protein